MKIIRRVLRKRRVNGSVGSSVKTKELQPFAGGDLLLFPHHAELLGIKIVADTGPGYSMKVLHQLRPIRPQVPVFRSLEELKNATGAHCDGTITGSMRTIRRNSTGRLRKYRRIDCQNDDVVARTEQGYHYRDWINVIVVGEDNGPACVRARDLEVPALRPESNSVYEIVGSGREARQQWAIEQMSRGVEFERRMIECKFGVAAKTAKRDMADLVNRGKAEYVRIGSGGHYRSKGRVSVR